MKKIALIIIVLFATISAFFFFTRESVADTCEGRCTGSSNCTACSSCNYCKHCNSGGSCGVCSSGSSSSSDKYNTSPSPSSPSESKKYTIKSTSSEISSSLSKEVSVKHKSTIKIYYVKSSILNIRKEASKSSEIICVVKKKKKIKILKSHDDNWYLVESFCEGKKVKGFVTKASIIKY
ncbi:MAG: SH3 domain-containing protein [Bacteroidetes bacterium]|nr:SH3 domain-containing protein [Bacteroidota bacterium]